MAPRGKHEGFDIALRISIGFWGPVYYNVNKLLGVSSKGSYEDS